MMAKLRMSKAKGPDAEIVVSDNFSDDAKRRMADREVLKLINCLLYTSPCPRD